MMEQTPQGHPQNFDRSVATLFARTINILQPGAGGRSIVKLLDGRVGRTTALHWRSGRRAAPRWAIELLASKLDAHLVLLNEIADSLKRMPERPGRKAGTINIKRYHATRQR